ncbi:hypothetical protein [Escherichia phage RDN8.1]|nr:hypothetical protein [Escherichia phage RDN8.1]
MSKLIEDLRSQLIDNPRSGGLSADWELIESGEWTDSHKSESKADIVKHMPTGRLFEVDFYRTGDHWQGYETEFSGAVEVEPYEAVVVLYRPVKLLDVVVPAMSKAKAIEPCWGCIERDDRFPHTCGKED